MNRLALDPSYRRVSVKEFLQMDFHDAKAELIDGCIFMMAGAGSLHNLVAGNIFGSFWTKLKGTGCRPYGSDQAVETAQDTARYPDISVYCGDTATPKESGQLLLGTPKVIVEVLSPSTEQYDQREKLAEYRDLEGVDCLIFVAPEDKRIRVVERRGANDWFDRWLGSEESLSIASLNLTLNRAEIFSTDS